MHFRMKNILKNNHNHTSKKILTFKDSNNYHDDTIYLYFLM